MLQTYWQHLTHGICKVKCLGTHPLMPRLISGMGTVPLGGRGGMAASTASECSSSFMTVALSGTISTGRAAITCADGDCQSFSIRRFLERCQIGPLLLLR